MAPRSHIRGNDRELYLLACKDVLDLVLPEEFSVAAAEALQSGSDSHSLTILAGLLATESDDARALFHRALAELNIPRPSKREAVMMLARETAERILKGDTPPLEGAKTIWHLSNVLGEHLPELDTFVYGASEFEDRPQDQAIFEKGILAAAGDLVNARP